MALPSRAPPATTRVYAVAPSCELVILMLTYNSQIKAHMRTVKTGAANNMCRMLVRMPNAQHARHNTALSRDTRNKPEDMYYATPSSALPPVRTNRRRDSTQICIQAWACQLQTTASRRMRTPVMS